MSGNSSVLAYLRFWPTYATIYSCIPSLKADLLVSNYVLRALAMTALKIGYMGVSTNVLITALSILLIAEICCEDLVAFQNVTCVL